jgi:UDP-N-acetylglucosamine--N-acetylmuramyl-(pentapeptide) pyrophosphoryl-undecaprenol N-acetylglucosamine transferase
MKMKIAIAGGGTGGHISPAVSIAKEMEKLGFHIIYIGNNKSMEERIANANNLEFYKINVQRLYRKFTLKHVLFPIKLILSIIKSIKIMSDNQVVAFIGTGGFVSGPVALGAKLIGIPIFLHEQNSYPGLTTRKLSKYAEIVFLGNIEAQKYLPECKTVYSGNPINIEKTNLSKEEIFNKYSLNPNYKTVFIMGGSQGSKIINEITEKILEQISDKNYNLIWQVGIKNKHLIKRYENKKNLIIFDFNYRINRFYKIADILVSRAGALTLSEIEFHKIPSILIPYPYAAGNHQYYNALEMKKKGVSEIISQKEVSPKKILQKIDLMFENIKKYKRFDEVKNSSQIISKNIFDYLKRIKW